ncbi:MAG: hypothetical protein QOI07_375 [Verrucomicrobiota bacterium]|jgi:hypothetical protein
MKKFSVFPLIVALAFFVSCQKQQTEEERKAEVERQVQDRLAAERVDAEKQRLAQQQTELDAREKALANREVASPTPVEESAAPPAEEVVTETADGRTRSETQTTASYGMFYEKLDPNGEWRETKDYGYVWQPREAETSRDWRPYTEGRWVYSDAGWTWVSDEKFGWATYHYGRWVRLRRVGWVWVPGQEWAPAWVSWRTSKDYVGWAPLPPEARFDRKSGIHNWADSYYDIGPDQYAFVPSNEFGAEHVRRVVVPSERNISIVIETTNVTRITFANTTIMNEGPSYDELRSRGQRPIERYRLRRERNTEMQARVTAGELEVSVPILSDVRNIFRPRRVKERVAEVNVDNGWTSVSDRSAAERARTKIRSEATPPPNAPLKKFVPPAETSPAPAASATIATSPNAPNPTATIASTSPSPTIATSPAAASPSATVARTSPSPTAAAAASASTTPAAVSPTPADAGSTASPSVSRSPRPKTFPTIRPSTKARIDAARGITPSASTTPATQTDMSPAAPAATATPATPALPTINPTLRPRPSPSIPPRPIQTPPPVQRTTPPLTTAPPVDAATTPVTTPASTPPPRRPIVSPRPVLPTATPGETTETARPPVPRDVPRHTPPPRVVAPPVTSPAPPVATTPNAATTPNVAPSVPPAADQRTKNRRPVTPISGTTETGTPTPTPSAPPN